MCDSSCYTKLWWSIASVYQAYNLTEKAFRHRSLSRIFASHCTYALSEKIAGRIAALCFFFVLKNQKSRHYGHEFFDDCFSEPMFIRVVIPLGFFNPLNVAELKIDYVGIDAFWSSLDLIYFRTVQPYQLLYRPKTVHINWQFLVLSSTAKPTEPPHI